MNRDQLIQSFNYKKFHVECVVKNVERLQGEELSANEELRLRNCVFILSGHQMDATSNSFQAFKTIE